MKHRASLTSGALWSVKTRAWRLVRSLLVLSAAGVLAAYVVSGFRPGPRGLNEAAVPADVADQITVLGLPNARFWAWYDLKGAALVREWEQSLDRERAAGASDDALPPAQLPGLRASR